MSNPIKPDHYHKKGLDPIAVMKQTFFPAEVRGFYKGNILKYIMRYQNKNGLEDLKKLQEYVQLLIELEELETHKAQLGEIQPPLPTPKPLPFKPWEQPFTIGKQTVKKPDYWTDN